MDEELSAQRRAEVMRQRAEMARQEWQRLEEQAAHWQAGADGERLVAAALTSLAGRSEGAVVLHDRLLTPGQSRVNLDHIVATQAGVFLVDAKTWSGELSVDEFSLWQRTGTGGGSRRYSRHAELDKVATAAATMERLLFGSVVPVVALANPHHTSVPPVQVRGVHVIPVPGLVAWLDGQPARLGRDQLDSLRVKLEALFPPATGTTHQEPPAHRRVSRPTTAYRPRPAASAPRGRRRPKQGVGARLLKLLALGVGLVLLLTNLKPIATLAGGLFARVITSSVSPPAVPSTTSASSSVAPSLPPSKAAPSPNPSAAGLTLLDGSAAPSKACQGVNTQDIEQLWGQPVTDHDYGKDKTRCGWHLTPPTNPYVPADITITTGYAARIATASLTAASVVAKLGAATILIPQHTLVPGSTVAAKNITQPMQITYRYTYPGKSTAATNTAADKAAAAKVTQLAQQLAGRLPQGPGADNTALIIS